MDTAIDIHPRERILDAALELFSQHGYAGTSVRQIAARVGLRPSSLYSHFDGKEAILSTLIDTYGPASNASRLASPGYRALSGDPAAFCRQYAGDLLDLHVALAPCMLGYAEITSLIVAWCELRAGFRHFRTDRIYECRVLDELFTGQGDALRAIWPDQNRWEPAEAGLAETS